MAYDILPFPNITASEAKEQVAQINNYLIQLKETLEFVLTNINSDNLSAELNQKLNELGADIKTNAREQDDQLQQVASRSGITVSDVINSAAFEKALEDVEDQIPTKYLASVTEEAGEAETTYTFTDESGQEVVISISEDTGDAGSGVDSLFKIVSGNYDYTCEAGKTVNFTIPFTAPEGYTPIALYRVTAGSSAAFIHSFNAGGYMGLRNTGSSDITSNAKMDVLYAKSNAIS